MAGPHKPERVYLDSNVWIDWFQNDSRSPAVRRVLEWADSGQLQLLVSPLHLVECLGRRPTEQPVGADPAATIEQLLTTGPVSFVEFDLRVALRARRLRPEIEDHVALSEYHERLVQYLAARGEVTVAREVLALHSLNGQTFRPPLGIHVAADEMRRQMRAADDAEAAWSAIVRRIDHLVGTADPREVELVLTSDGVVCRRL